MTHQFRFFNQKHMAALLLLLLFWTVLCMLIGVQTRQFHSAVRAGHLVVCVYIIVLFCCAASA